MNRPDPADYTGWPSLYNEALAKYERKHLAIQRGAASHQGANVYRQDTATVKTETLEKLFYALRNGATVPGTKTEDLLRDLIWQGLGRTLT